MLYDHYDGPPVLGVIWPDGYDLRSEHAVITKQEKALSIYVYRERGREREKEKELRLDLFF